MFKRRDQRESDGDNPMILWSAAALWLLGSGATQPAAAGEPLRFAQLVVREQIIVRVPVRPRPAPAVSWKESKGPKCVPARAIGGSGMVAEDSVDLILRNGARLRARLQDRCPALDYYYGFYMTPGADGQVCADRDNIRSRVGSQCRIERFRTLTPVPRD
jgi:hypothetical protein